MAKTLFTLSEMQDRQDRVRGWMAKSGVDACLFTSPSAIAYLTEVATPPTDEAVLLLTQLKADPFHDVGDSLVSSLKSLGSSVKRLGVEFDSATLRLRKLLLDSMASLDLVDLASAMRRLRLVKSADEIKLITKLAQIGEAALAPAAKRLGAGASGVDVAIEALSLMHREVAKLGPAADVLAHDFSVSTSGAKAECVTLSVAASYAGYGVPLHRTIAKKKATPAVTGFQTACEKIETNLRKLLRPGVRLAEIAASLNGFVSEQQMSGIKPGNYGFCPTGLRRDGERDASLTLSATGEATLQPGMLVSFDPIASADAATPSFRNSSLYLITEGQPRLLAGASRKGIVQSSTKRALRGKPRKTA